MIVDAHHISNSTIWLSSWSVLLHEIAISLLATNFFGELPVAVVCTWIRELTSYMFITIICVHLILITWNLQLCMTWMLRLTPNLLSWAHGYGAPQLQSSGAPELGALGCWAPELFTPSSTHRLPNSSPRDRKVKDWIATGFEVAAHSVTFTEALIAAIATL